MEPNPFGELSLGQTASDACPDECCRQLLDAGRLNQGRVVKRVILGELGLKVAERAAEGVELTITVALKELHEVLTGARLDDVRKELAAELGFLCGPARGQVEQCRVEQCSVDSDRVVAAVDVAGVEFSGDEAAIDPGPLAPGDLQRRQRTTAPVEPTKPPARRAERLLDLGPSRGPLTGWQATVE